MLHICPDHLFDQVIDRNKGFPVDARFFLLVNYLRKHKHEMYKRSIILVKQERAVCRSELPRTPPAFS